MDKPSTITRLSIIWKQIYLVCEEKTYMILRKLYHFLPLYFGKLTLVKMS